MHSVSGIAFSTQPKSFQSCVEYFTSHMNCIQGLWTNVYSSIHFTRFIFHSVSFSLLAVKVVVWVTRMWYLTFNSERRVSQGFSYPWRALQLEAHTHTLLLHLHTPPLGRKKPAFAATSHTTPSIHIRSTFPCISDSISSVFSQRHTEENRLHSSDVS